MNDPSANQQPSITDVTGGRIIVQNGMRIFVVGDATLTKSAVRDVARLHRCTHVVRPKELGALPKADQERLDAAEAKRERKRAKQMGEVAS